MCYSFIWYPQREIGLKGISSAVSSSHAQSAKQDHTSNRLKQHHSPVLLLICSKVVLSNPGSLYRLLLLQSVSQGVAAGGSHKIETRNGFLDFRRRDDVIHLRWCDSSSKSIMEQRAKWNSTARGYRNHVKKLSRWATFFFLTTLFVVSWGIVNLFLIVFSSENSQTF